MMAVHLSIRLGSPFHILPPRTSAQTLWAAANLTLIHDAPAVDLGLTSMQVLVSGAGIAGPTLAFWLKAAGFEPTLIERAPALRTGGYVIDFWGLGYDIAERMGLTSDINRIGYHVRELRIVDERGKRVAGFGTRVFGELTGGRYVTLGRSELSRLLFEKIRATTEVIFDNEIVGLQERTDCVLVQFKHSGERRFDLVIGADGLHSGVRKLAFGPQHRFEKHLGYVGRGVRSPRLPSTRRRCVPDVRTAGTDARALYAARRSDAVLVRFHRRRRRPCRQRSTCRRAMLRERYARREVGMPAHPG